MQPEEAGADDEREPDQQQPCVPAAARALADRDREREADERGDEDEPEMRGLVLPPLVDLRDTTQQEGERDGERIASGSMTRHCREV